MRQAQISEAGQSSGLIPMNRNPLYGDWTRMNSLSPVIGIVAGFVALSVVHETAGNTGDETSVPPGGDHETINELPDLVAVRTGRAAASR